ncbi:thiol reductase thioredoxin [Subtercola boreus]|uniref:Thiol reductase thioredoxin n=1 Tax=Subtercola boreus TaxID=120213 RepID=A0A3E0VC33_9MICO|nr:thioredoxin family protein [Subtercola boreus]RFA07414.1 thiol reductase thioredoxin [Subtercola boreus]
MRVELWSSSFCGACASTRAVLERAHELVPDAALTESNVALSPAAAESDGITATPTVIVTTDNGREVFRAVGVPTLPQVLGAVALALLD